jgi:hypothetical protein
MPKNTYFIKENYKKVEEVREIENETPSFEKFMETYEIDERVVNSYEDEINHVNVWASKGSGPCYVCYKDTQWRDLYIGCPTDYCGSNSTSYWYHSNSGYLNASDQSGCGRLEISNKGVIKCRGCGTSSSIKNWSFSCSSHRGNYRSTSYDAFQRSLMMAGDFNEMIADLNTYLRSHR